MTTIATLQSASSPLAGQSNRSSWANMSYRALPDGTVFTLTVSGGSAGVSFNIMQDVSGGSDPTVVKGATNGSEVRLDSNKAYYISNPQNANAQPFVVGFVTNT